MKQKQDHELAVAIAERRAWEDAAILVSGLSKPKAQAAIESRLEQAEAKVLELRAGKAGPA